MMDVQAIRDEVYEKCIRKAEQRMLHYQACGSFKLARVLEELAMSLKSMRHSEHEVQRREQS